MDVDRPTAKKRRGDLRMTGPPPPQPPEPTPPKVPTVESMVPKALPKAQTFVISTPRARPPSAGVNAAPPLPSPLPRSFADPPPIQAFSQPTGPPSPTYAPMERTMRRWRPQEPCSRLE
jgi:hypothetical protein